MSESFLPTDSELLAEFASSGSERPFEVLVRRHGGLVLAVCRGILRDANDAEDAAQAAFLTLARKAKSLIGHRTIAGWLHTVAWHISCRARRARSLRQQREREAAETNAAIQSAREEPSHADTSVLHEQLLAMPDKYRLPLILHHFDGWSEAEVAQILGCKLGTISGRLSRGRQILKERLVARGIGGIIADEEPSDDGSRRSPARARTLGAIAVVPAASFIASAARAGAQVHRVGGGVGEGVVSTQAAALSDGFLRVMQRSKIRATVAVVVAFAIVGSIVGLVAYLAAPRPNTDGGGATPAAAQMYFPRVARSDNSITGTIVDPDGNAVPQVMIRVFANKSDATAGRRAMARNWSREDGSFTIDNVAPGKGRYLLAVADVNTPNPRHAELNLDIAPNEFKEVGRLVLKTGRY